MTNSLLVQWVRQFIREFGAVNVKSPLKSAKCSQAWKPPTNFVFKVNVPATIFSSQHMCGVGVVIKDEMGLVVGALSKMLNFPLGSLEAEAKAFEKGVLFAKDIGIHEIILEGDSMVVSNAILGKSPPSSIASVVYGIVSLSRRFEVSHVCRNGSMTAHLLVKHAKGVGHYVT